MTVKLQCLSCLHTEGIDPKIYEIRVRSGLPFRCRECPSSQEMVTVGHDRSYKKSALLKRSKAQEKKAAKRIGGRVQAGSGNQPGTKGDVRRQGEVRLECKLTTAKSYRLNLADLIKIEQAAYSGEKPALEIEFQGVHPTRRYVVLPGWVYDYYSGLAGDQS